MSPSLGRSLSRGVRARRLAVPAAVLVLAAAGCSGGGSEEPSAGPTTPSTPAPTPLAQVRTTELTVGRASFCARVAPDAVSGAVGGEPTRSERWRNGQRAALATGLTDVANEFGCRWTAGTGASATAWVFAPPMTAAEARRLRADALRNAGCRAAPGIPRFGRPTVAVRCTRRGATTVALHGLFGDAWLSCALTEPARSSSAPSTGSPTASPTASPSESSSESSSGSSSGSSTGSSTGSSPTAPLSLVDRTEQWCVSVALAAAV